tara:strand:+ start:66 stop:872 length:807 start_codon:yes stop_codon:yes gene_type:complete
MRPKKSLGQNFLIDKNLIKKIALKGENISNKNIIEIGPGTGNLTDEIINLNPKTITLIEKDKNLFEDLKNRYRHLNNIKIFNEDILDFDLEKFTPKDSIIYGNLPYNISSQILIKLIKFKVWPPKFKKLILMFQKELGEKIAAHHKNKNFGRISVIANWRLKITDKFLVSNSCFYPKPKVDSILLVFKVITNEKFKIKEITNLETVTQVMFSRKRKMINKAFKVLFKDPNEIAKKIKIDLSLRPGELTKSQFYKVTEFYEKGFKKIKF